MAKAGLAVPAAHPVKLPPFSRVLADIGDDQSIASSLSTFSGHLNQIQVGPGCPAACSQLLHYYYYGPLALQCPACNLHNMVPLRKKIWENDGCLSVLAQNYLRGCECSGLGT